MTITRDGITTFGLRNFKAFHFLSDINICPLTVLVGSNNSGKSSILQSLALLKQTLISGSSNTALRFDGDLVRLDNFETIISTCDVSRPLEYRFNLKSKMTGRVARVYFPHLNVTRIDEQRDYTTNTDIKIKFSQGAENKVSADFSISTSSSLIF